MTQERRRTARRLSLLDDLLDYALRSSCSFIMCDGPEAPIRANRTCTRCACINRATRIGLVVRAAEQYVRRHTSGGDIVVAKGCPEQHR